DPSLATTPPSHVGCVLATTPLRIEAYLLGKQSNMGNNFFDLFQVTPWRERFAGCKFKSETKDSITKISVDGENKDGLRSLTLDANGMPAEMDLEHSGPGMQQKQKMHGKATTIEIGGEYAISRIDMTIPTPQGNAEMRMEYEYSPQGDAHLISKLNMSMKMNMGGPSSTEVQSMAITFTEFLVNGAAPAPAGK
ncbi:MAG: hypothetical protein L0Z55_04340, partial [Planctomycetes bacterium]|nr:hypothetical protein [Planctomycetota bacterium]